MSEKYSIEELIVRFLQQDINEDEAGDDGSTEITTTAAEGGTPVAGETTNITVSVNGTDYLFSEAFTAADLPEGYTETMLTCNGEERQIAKNGSCVCIGERVYSARL